MTDSVQVDLGDVQKTLLLPLWGRAQESRKPKPLLVDETAVRIIDQVDFDFSAIARNVNHLVQVGWVKRSLLYDRAVTAFLGSHPQATIVNIGCGLDTTFERTDNGQLRWYDLDLPDVIALRRRFIQEHERRTFLATSFLESDWLEEIDVVESVLFMAAGVFYYFAESQLRSFIIRLLDRYPGSELLFDASSPLGVKVCNKQVVGSSGLGEKSYLIWGLKRTKDLEQWDDRIKIVDECHYYGSEATGLPDRVVGMLANALRIQYMVHLRLGTVEHRARNSASRERSSP